MKLHATLAMMGVAACDPRPIVPSRSRVKVCRGSDWDAISNCLVRRAHAVVRDWGTAKLVAMPSQAATQYALYVQGEDAWRALPNTWSINERSVLLDAGKVDPSGFRVDIASSQPTTIMLDEMPRSVVIRRVQTTICSVTGTCDATTSSCEVLVHGKARFWYRGELQWTGDKIEVQGDTSNTGAYCAITRSRSEL